MKAAVYDIKGSKMGEISLPARFNTRVRDDIALKYYESDKYYSPHAPSPRAGRRHSASGTISHQRHDWKGHYGKGIARVPRKAMWRRGEQFYWVGAEINSARGGRAVHAPRIIYRPLKINIKEKKMAMDSALAATAHKNYVSRRYDRLKTVSLPVPFVLVSPIAKLKTKQFIEFLKTVLGENYMVALQQASVRSGKGKFRGRMYKHSAGLLLVTGSDESVALKGIDIRRAGDIIISDLYPLGRLTLYTEQALKELA